ncbi:hypothetical protein GCM10023347_33660 [Streptomyces chumphonensis]|nr:hypothetical protein [Streptomyces chumphonensis]
MPTPQETFWSDQTLAAVRDAARDPKLLPVAVVAAPDNTRCSWCDCDDSEDSPHNRPGYRCAGCPETAMSVVAVHSGPHRRYDYPACDRHRDDIITTLVRATGGRP